MAAQPTLVVRVTLGEPRMGEWCDACALPSAFIVNVSMITPDGVSTIGAIRGCTECEDD